MMNTNNERYEAKEEFVRRAEDDGCAAILGKIMIGARGNDRRLSVVFLCLWMLRE